MLVFSQGPFKRFTAIVGPNGAGKSNLMDAISFVLGVRTMQLRGQQLRDLIFRKEGEETVERDAYVKLSFAKASAEEEEEGGEEDDEAAEILTFARKISSSGASSYVLNGRTVTWERYSKALAEIGVNVTSRKFLVFQGDVESIAGMAPRELTTYFEKVSGSDELKDAYGSAEASKNQSEARRPLLEITEAAPQLLAPRRLLLSRLSSSRRNVASTSVTQVATLPTLLPSSCWTSAMAFLALAIFPLRTRRRSANIRGRLCWSRAYRPRVAKKLALSSKSFALAATPSIARPCVTATLLPVLENGDCDGRVNRGTPSRAKAEPGAPAAAFAQVGRGAACTGTIEKPFCAPWKCTLTVGLSRNTSTSASSPATLQAH